EREPNAERNGDRQLLLDELENGGVAKIAPAEIEPQIVPQHQEKALVGRLVEAELLLQALDEFRVEALGTAVFGGHRVDGGAAAGLPPRAEIAARRPGDARGRSGVGPRELGDHAFDRPARGELHHHERDQHDAEQRRDHEQQSPDDVGGHVVSASARGDLRPGSMHIVITISLRTFSRTRIDAEPGQGRLACAGSGPRTPRALTLPRRPAHAARTRYPRCSSFAALSRSYHQVSGAPRAYRGLVAGRLNTSQ